MNSADRNLGLLAGRISGGHLERGEANFRGTEIRGDGEGSGRFHGPVAQPEIPAPSGQLPVVERVQDAAARLRAGRPVIVVDDADGTGDLVFAAARATPELMAFMVRHTSGCVCVAMPEEACDRLQLPQMCALNEAPRETAYTVTVDAAAGISTGISAADRALTVSRLADPTVEAADFTRPGHVLPLRTRPGGTLERAGGEEAAVDLCRAASVAPFAVRCELVSSERPGDMARRPELEAFAREHSLALVSIADVVAYRQATETQVVRLAEAQLPTPYGPFTAVGFGSPSNELECFVMVCGEIGDGLDVPLHLHVECVTGDLFGSLDCDCRPRLLAGLRDVSAVGRGVVVYLRSPGSAADLQHGRQVVRSTGTERATSIPVPVPVPEPPDGAAFAARVLSAMGVRSACPVGDDAGTGSWLRDHGLAAPLPASPAVLSA